MPTSQRRRKDREQTLQPSTSTPATALSASAAPLTPAPQVKREPAQSDIAHRAFHRFEKRGHEHGGDVDDWLDAERELQQEQPEERFVESDDDYDDAA